MCGRTSLLLLFSIFSTLIHLVLTKDVYGYDCSFTKNHNKYIEIDLTETRSCSNTEPKFKDTSISPLSINDTKIRCNMVKILHAIVTLSLTLTSL